LLQQEVEPPPTAVAPGSGNLGARQHRAERSACTERREAVNGAARARSCDEETPTRHGTLIFPAARVVAPWPSG
jgi:hypothetical protein